MSVIGARKGVHVDIERIFTVKVQVFGQVEFTVESILQALFKIAFKALIEAVRQTTLTPRRYLQLQVDVQALRQSVGAFLRDSGVAENLLEEVSSGLMYWHLIYLPVKTQVLNSSMSCFVYHRL